jgi:hypothetical protein
VIDNFFRRVLVWSVSAFFDPNATVEVLLTAAQGIGGDKPLLLADGGVENFNGAVDELIASGLLSRVLAQTEITFSNSMVESWWRVLKHPWLFLNTFDSVRTVENSWRSMSMSTTQDSRAPRSGTDTGRDVFRHGRRGSRRSGSGCNTQQGENSRT